MKPRWRITVPGRRRELADLIENKLIDFDKGGAKFIYTYPHRAVAEAMTVAVVVLEKGAPHLFTPAPDRRDRLAKAILEVHEKFDSDHRWGDGYDHGPTAQFLADAIAASEVRGRGAR